MDPAVWRKWIAPETIVEQVRNTAPFLFGPPMSSAFVEILSRQLDPQAPREEQLYSYFALCLAAHHATVATFVPTDVDSKIRGLLWLETRDPVLLARMFDLALEMHSWPLKGVSTRWDLVEGRPISGHDGEWLSVMAGSLGRFLQLGLSDLAERAGAAIEAELERQSHGFRLAFAKAGDELLTLRLAMSITHNVGDLDQGISFWEGVAARSSSFRTRFSRLAHENTNAYQGTFQTAANLYRIAMASEGHRHYPLRGVKPLRRSPDLLLPLGPFLDDWGARVAIHPALDTADRAEVLEALVLGCKKVPNQQGYYRALAGFRDAQPGEFDRAVAKLPNAAQKLARDPKLRQLIAIPRISFESSMRKKVEALRKRD